MSIARLSGREFKYSESMAETKDEYIKELERFYELFVDYQNSTSQLIRDKEMRILILKWENRKLKNKLNKEKINV
jgi:hypothetical protein